MSNAFIDTTILTDILLNTGERRNKAKESLSRFDKTILPVYAIKEFKAGPLRNVIYAHNKLATTGSFSKTIEAFQRLSLTPQRYKTATGLQALMVAQSSIAKKTMKHWVAKYGENCENDKVQCDECRLALKIKILAAWKRRRSIFTETVYPLSCYDEISPFEKFNLIEDSPVKCRDGMDCAVKSFLTKSPSQLEKLKKAINPQSTKGEDLKRLKILKKISNHPRCELKDQECRSLGDAIFACLAPPDSVILTTNVRDHAPLAEALGKRAESP